ncbi:MAG: hypothetical protein ACJA0S_001039 [Rickettsiales bacterium]|jgi:hypothetical protein
MKKIILAIFALCVLSSCTTTSNGVSSGMYTSWKDRDPISRVNNEVKVTKKGESCVTNILGIVATGDSSIEAAKKDGNINNVAYVDRTYSGFWFYLPFFQKGCTVVNGN